MAEVDLEQERSRSEVADYLREFARRTGRGLGRLAIERIGRPGRPGRRRRFD